MVESRPRRKSPAGRRREPLTSRRLVEVALHLLETEGLEALTVRRIGEELGFNGAAMYYHVKNKADIVAQVVATVLRDVQRPESDEVDLSSLGARNIERLHKALVEHPSLIPAVRQQEMFTASQPDLDYQAQLLQQQGVPDSAIANLIEIGHWLAIVCATAETAPRAADEELLAERYPHLARAIEHRQMSTGDLLIRAYRAGADAVLSAAGGLGPRPAGSAALNSE